MLRACALLTPQNTPRNRHFFAAWWAWNLFNYLHPAAALGGDQHCITMRVLHNRRRITRAFCLSGSLSHSQRGVVQSISAVSQSSRKIGAAAMLKTPEELRRAALASSFSHLRCSFFFVKKNTAPYNVALTHKVKRWWQALPNRTLTEAATAPWLLWNTDRPLLQNMLNVSLVRARTLPAVVATIFTRRRQTRTVTSWWPLPISIRMVIQVYRFWNPMIGKAIIYGSL